MSMHHINNLAYQIKLIFNELDFFIMYNNKDYVREFFQSNIFVIGYYILTVGSSLLLIKETKKRMDDLKIGISSIKYALYRLEFYLHMLF